MSMDGGACTATLVGPQLAITADAGKPSVRGTAPDLFNKFEEHKKQRSPDH